MQKQNLYSDEDLLIVTSNMINKGKKPIIEEHSFDTEMEEALHYTHLKTSVMTPKNYKRLVGDSDKNMKSIVTTQQ